MAMVWIPYNPDEPNGGGYWGDDGTNAPIAGGDVTGRWDAPPPENIPPVISSPPVVVGGKPALPPGMEKKPDYPAPYGDQWKQPLQSRVFPGKAGLFYLKNNGDWVNVDTGEIVRDVLNPPHQIPGQGGLNPPHQGGYPVPVSTSTGGSSGYSSGRLTIQPIAGASELAIMNAIRSERGMKGWTIEEVEQHLKDPNFLEGLALDLNMDISTIQNVTTKVLSTGLSGLLMFLTGSFPLAAMGYFASDRLLGGADSKQKFAGWLAGQAQVDGQLVLPMGMAVPEGLPNEIFDEFRFICYDRLSKRWWPTDEVRPLPYDSEEYRWFILDRVHNKVYHADWIKKPAIYV